jgi:hypothetical protein
MRLSKRGLGEVWRGLLGSPRLRRVVSFGLMLCTLAFLVVLLVRGRDELSQFTDWQNYLYAIVLGLLLYPISLVIHAWVWSRMIARLGKSRSGWWDVEIFAYTHLIRRLPGAVWYLASRSLMYHDRGVKAGVTLVASGLEWLWMVLAGLLVFGLLSLAGIGSLLLGLAVGVALWVVGYKGPYVLGSLKRWGHLPAAARRWLERAEAVNLPTGGDLVLWMVAYCITYGIAGSILLILVRAVDPKTALTLDEAIRVWALTASASTLVVGILPAGLGVRELTITALLTPTVPLMVSLFVAVLIRLLFVVGDMLWGGMMWGIGRLGARWTAQNGLPEDPNNSVPPQGSTPRE